MSSNHHDFKVGLSRSKKFVFIYFNDSSLKMMNNSFYFMLKDIFFLKTQRAGQHIIAIHILSNISRSKRNKTMKFGQLIEYNMRNIFLEKSYSKYGEDASPRPFYEK